MQEPLASLFAARSGHFRFESGHHGDLWLDLELLYLHPRRIRPLAIELAGRLAPYDIEVVCGPLVEGAFVALTVADELNVAFTYSERFDNPQHDGLYSVEYRLPPVLRDQVRGKRVAIVNDVINAGSAVRGTYADLLACGAQPVVVAALLVLGTSASTFAADHGLALEGLTDHPNALWLPQDCPLCAEGVPLDTILA
ncbi:MAG: hypothetical protein U0984_04710 [Prosthecobacter sp.]|nr:hypothetical protein [Prosthecobacter sp.]